MIKGRKRVPEVLTAILIQASKQVPKEQRTIKYLHAVWAILLL